MYFHQLAVSCFVLIGRVDCLKSLYRGRENGADARFSQRLKDQLAERVGLPQRRIESGELEIRQVLCLSNLFEVFLLHRHGNLGRTYAVQHSSPYWLEVVQAILMGCIKAQKECLIADETHQGDQ